nr:retrovirus-related Pol polyprotein from transposon TNT 1-94 [Tanacetum cinerariifolium]
MLLADPCEFGSSNESQGICQLATDLDEIEEVNANCILMANLQQSSTSGTQTDKAPVYDLDGSVEDSSVEQSEGTIEQHPANVEETRALYDLLYQNLAVEVEKVNTVNHKLIETNAELTFGLARFKNQEKCFEISQKKYDKLERCYQQSVYQEQCLSKKINALHLSSSKQIMTLNEEILDLNKQLSKEKSTVSFLLGEKKKLKFDFKTRKDKLLDKQIQLEKKIKELDNILVKTGQSIQTIHMLSPKPDSFYHTEHKMALGYRNPFYLKQAQKKQQNLYDGKVLLEKHDPPIVHNSAETLQLAQESRQKMKQLNKEITLANYTKINHLSRVFVSQTAKSREELYFSNASKTANVSKAISIPNEEFSDDTRPSIARKFLNEVKNTIVTLQRVVKHRMTLETHNLSSSAHQELHKIVKDEIFPIVNQVDARVQNFEIQFLKEAAKFVGDFKYLVKEADESLAKHKTLELEIERLLRAVVSHDIMSVVQKASVVDTSTLRTELERTKERFENCIIKKENEYVSVQKDNTRGTSTNTKFAKQSILGKPPMLGETYALSKPVTSNSIPTPQESKVVKTDKTTLRPEAHSLGAIKKNDRVPSASKSSRSKNKEVEVEEHHMNLLLSNNKKHTSSACNNIKLDSYNVISKVFCAMCKQCLISVNHDVCLRNVNGKTSHGKKQKANVSIKEKQKKRQPKVKKTKKVEFIERLATPKPSKPRFFLRWSPTGRLFDLKGKVIQICLWCVDSGCSKHMIRYLKLLINFIWKFMGTIYFGNNHVAAILGFDDLQWGNILITRVYFIKGLGHNLFSVGQFYDLDLEVAFKNACFVINLEGVYLLKGDRSTNLYTINLHEMASASPVCLMARASSTKSWLWHQRLSHLNFDTINDLTKNDLVSGLPKFKYHKEHLCTSRKKQKGISSTQASSKFKAEVTPSSYGFVWSYENC